MMRQCIMWHIPCGLAPVSSDVTSSSMSSVVASLPLLLLVPLIFGSSPAVSFCSLQQLLPMLLSAGSCLSAKNCLSFKLSLQPRCVWLSYTATVWWQYARLAVIVVCASIYFKVYPEQLTQCMIALMYGLFCTSIHAYKSPALNLTKVSSCIRLF